MSVKAKYQSVLDLGQDLGVSGGNVSEENGVLKMWGTVSTPYEKDALWDAIKKVGGAAPADLVADIKVENTAIYARHTVKKGESLSLIAKHYYGDLMKYKAIFEANRDILKNADTIEIGQDLVIPNV